MNTETQPREWTPERLARETVLSFRGKLSDPETFEYLYEIILRAINTAIAAAVIGERKALQADLLAERKVYTELEADLAAERKLRQSVERDIVLLNEMVSREKEQLRQQLDAERAMREEAAAEQEISKEWFDKWGEEKAKVKPLVERLQESNGVLKVLLNFSDDVKRVHAKTLCEVIDKNTDALAKVKEG